MRATFQVLYRTMITTKDYEGLQRGYLIKDFDKF